MIELYSKVLIKKYGITGIVVDVSDENGKVRYIVESDAKEPPRSKDAYPSPWPLYDCYDIDIEESV